MTDPAVTDLERLHDLAVREADRGIDQQQAVLDQLRTRSVALVAVGSAVATFVGVRMGSLGVPGWTALAAYAGTVGLAGWVLLPRGGWFFARNAKTIVLAGESFDGPGQYSEYLRSLALWTEDSRQSNKAKLDELATHHTVALCLLGVQVVLWVLEAHL